MLSYTAADDSSAGGGGRIAVRLTGTGATLSDAWIAKINAKGYYSSKITAAFSSSAGSVYLQTAAQAEGAGTIIVRNTGDTANNIAVTEIPSLKAGGEDDDFRRDGVPVGMAVGVPLEDGDQAISADADRQQRSFACDEVGGIQVHPACLRSQERLRSVRATTEVHAEALVHQECAEAGVQASLPILVAEDGRVRLNLLRLHFEHDGEGEALGGEVFQGIQREVSLVQAESVVLNHQLSMGGESGAPWGGIDQSIFLDAKIIEESSVEVGRWEVGNGELRDVAWQFPCLVLQAKMAQNDWRDGEVAGLSGEIATVQVLRAEEQRHRGILSAAKAMGPSIAAMVGADDNQPVLVLEVPTIPNGVEQFSDAVHGVPRAL